jgi:hypothetical protein
VLTYLFFSLNKHELDPAQTRNGFESNSFILSLAQSSGKVLLAKMLANMVVVPCWSHKKYNVMNHEEEEEAYLGKRWLLVIGWWRNGCSWWPTVVVGGGERWLVGQLEKWWFLASFFTLFSPDFLFLFCTKFTLIYKRWKRDIWSSLDMNLDPWFK